MKKIVFLGVLCLCFSISSMEVRLRLGKNEKRKRKPDEFDRFAYRVEEAAQNRASKAVLAIWTIQDDCSGGWQNPFGKKKKWRVDPKTIRKFEKNREQRRADFRQRRQRRIEAEKAGFWGKFFAFFTCCDGTDTL